MSNRIKSMINSIRNLLALSSKPTRDEFWLLFKIVLAGLFIVGIYAFTIQIISLALETLPQNPILSAIAGQIIILIITIIIMIVLIIFYYGRRKGKW
jgi:protein translocase SEC61 complex gamma subunit